MEDVVERTDVGRSDDPLIGRVLDGRYRVDAKIARGGMATVYSAHDVRLDRTVAVKVMHPGMGDDPEFVARFEREARSAARLSHHNVVAVFDQGDDDGTLFLVMEYVPGLTLRDEIRNDAPMDPVKALGLIEPVLAALAAAHGAGMIHRDVKPENVLLAGDGRVKVADFGLARAVNAETQHTATGGVLIGTVSYLSPELVVDGKADARSDVYAAGVLIYEMLTGQKPHQAESPIQVAYKHVHEDVPAPSLRVPGLPAYVDALVARATARDRDLRPSDARVLLHQVRRVRQALDHGIVDDPELVADLMPSRARTPETESTDDLALPREVVPLEAPYDYERDADAGLDFTAQIPQDEPVRRQPPPPPPAPRKQPVAAEPPRGYDPPRRSRRGLYLLIGLLLTALVVGIGAWQLGRYTTLPSVIKLEKSVAAAKLTKAGFKVTYGDPVYSDTVLDGSVVRTDPEQGARVAKGSEVTVILSQGPDLHSVPSTKGKTLDQVQTLIKDANLTVGTITQKYHETVPEGRVIGTTPAAGEMLKRDAAVDIVVSKGAKPIAIPDQTGKPAKAAEKALKKLGFKVTLSEDFSDTVKAGRVISQTPTSGTGFKNDTIRLVVSKGPELVQIPNVRGARTDDAAETLTELGFKVAVNRTALYAGLNIVVDCDPNQGELAPRGSTVTLNIV
ncbi:Stk1 family PASTA domain-containing Ser/Thr kinase [Nocardioides marmoriginsengisoli]|uniref:non-specific serine/threonine protein kinase n=1 Tax=Nocardioides marmoriginsengisoli TaxID=661483 RepID=A0A3N0CNL5_9ACTN|nr:Stk1 family PASTA domain-containing Ser/Thr kinase [Nocardioides marmoriginsengisoli]RNL65025.1 Stk1 family PASTA domain-containing Ser/Thr kinase [Nocardioides marmoriginsengisoli]